MNPALIDSLPGLSRPERRKRAFAERIDLSRLGEKHSEPTVVAPLDVPSLNAKYGMERAHWPRLKYATFRVPEDSSMAHFQELLKRSALRLLQREGLEGNELVSLSQADERWLRQRGWFEAEYLGEKPIIVGGHGPAFELSDDGVASPMAGMLEITIKANFRHRNPQPLRVELDPVLTNPIEIARGVPAA